MPHKREPERTAVPGGRESPSGAFKPQTGLRSKCRVFSAARSQRFRCAGPDGLRHPASASCLGRHSHPAGRCPNSSSLYPPLAAVVAVANKGLLALDNPKAVGLHTKKLAASLNDFFSFLRFEVAARRNVRATACFYADAYAPAGSQRQQMPFAVTAFPVKTQCRAVRRPPGIALL